MTAEQIASIAGVALSLALSYIPGLNGLWDKQPNDVKRAVLGLLLVGSAAGALVWQYQGDWALIQANWVGAVQALIAALVASQATYVITK